MYVSKLYNDTVLQRPGIIVPDSIPGPAVIEIWCALRMSYTTTLFYAQYHGLICGYHGYERQQ